MQNSIEAKKKQMLEKVEETSAKAEQIKKETIQKAKSHAEKV